MDASSLVNNNSVGKISEELYKKNKEINETLLETKQLAEELSEEKKKIEIILQNIIDVVIFIDENEKILLVNKAFEREFDIQKEQVLEKHLSEVITFENSSGIVSLKELETNIDTNTGVTKITKPLKINGNKSLYGTLGISNVINEDNKKRTILTIHNKTKEHELENMKLDFVSMAAHELRTPITSIRGYASLMSEELDAHKYLPTDDWKTLLGRITISSEQLLALVENLLNVTKIEKGIMSLACKTENWKHTILEITDIFQERAQAKKIKLTTNIPDTHINAYVDKMRIQEVLTNLLSNAVTYTPMGGEIVVEATKQNQWIQTSVKDNGKGIPKESQKHLFEKFFRVSGPLEQGSKGNGLGLYISKSIVEMHGGKIWVESEENKGANFIFTVPLVGE